MTMIIAVSQIILLATATNELIFDVLNGEHNKRTITS
jgi:hypothetical protein